MPQLSPEQLEYSIQDLRDLQAIIGQRQQLLERLSHVPPTRLAIACDPRRSPDRGTLGLLAELARSAASTRIWLLPAPAGETLDSARLGDWQQALTQLHLAYADSPPLAWLETGHE